jgi:hypothetical protein
MGLFDWSAIDVSNGAGSLTTNQCSYDGTYIWFTTRSAADATKRLWRLRHSDKALIKPNGSVGDYTNASVSLGTSVNVPYLPLATNGTYVAVSTDPNTITFYNCSDMTSAGTATVPDWNSWSDGRAMCFASGYFWRGGTDSTTTGRAALYKIDPSTFAVTRVFVHPTISGAFGGVWSSGTDLWCTWVSGNNGPVKVSTTGTLLASCATTTAVILVWISYDALRSEWWGAGIALEHVRWKDSDGTFVNPDGTDGTFATAKVAGPGTDTWFTDTAGIAVCGDHVMIGGTVEQLQRRSTANGCLGSGYWPQGNSAITGAPGAGIVVDVDYTVYFALHWAGLASSGAGGLMWTTFDSAAATPNLTNVSPGTGPHLSLTFDNPVGITGPTIGAASSGLGVTGVTAISTTQIDLACAIRPDHPVGQADTSTLAPPLGSAENLGPHVPTGVGATVI